MLYYITYVVIVLSGKAADIKENKQTDISYHILWHCFKKGSVKVIPAVPLRPVLTPALHFKCVVQKLHLKMIPGVFSTSQLLIKNFAFHSCSVLSGCFGSQNSYLGYSLMFHFRFLPMGATKLPVSALRQWNPEGLMNMSHCKRRMSRQWVYE